MTTGAKPCIAGSGWFYKGNGEVSVLWESKGKFPGLLIEKDLLVGTEKKSGLGVEAFY